tara:strand:+ start:5818 stop:6054 length:237 start_codon:yes stop_codon:yes gene_type:complete
MEMNGTSAVSVLKKRDKSIKELDSKCYKLSRLARTLLSALENSITHNEMSYDDKKSMKLETNLIIEMLEPSLGKENKD